MFRRLEGSLPKDPEFPADMKKLGFYVNETAHIRSIEKPDENFVFFITNNDRYNELHREAMARKWDSLWLHCWFHTAPDLELELKSLAFSRMPQLILCWSVQ